MHVVATAGHVDHGKSTLVRALTGMEPDRWAEERRRGMTIDLGFAWTTLPSGAQVAFVDVPGHERFVPNMLAGVGPVPAVMFVVAADEGWQPQSEEHLAALDAFRVAHALLVVSRADLADPQPAADDAAERIAATSLGVPAVVCVSGVTGTGVTKLRAELDRLVGRLPRPEDLADTAVRLWVDRAFSMSGAGTVVTGTLPAGRLRVGQQLVVAPAGIPVRVRGLQTLKRQTDEVSAVARVAVNLRGVPAGELRRGQALLTPERWPLTDELDVRLDVDPRTLRAELVLHVGSAAVPARVRPVGPDTARLRLASPLPLRGGDRALLRDPGRRRLAGGLSVLDPLPPPLARRGAARARGRVLAGVAGRPDADAEVDRRGVVRRSDLVLLGCVEPARRAVAAGDYLVSQARWAEWRAALGDLVDRASHGDPLAPGVPLGTVRRALGAPDDRVVAALAASDESLAVRAGRVLRPGRPVRLPAGAQAALDKIVMRLRSEPFAAPDAPELAELGLDARLLGAATRAGELLHVAEGVYLLPDAVARAAEVLGALSQPFTVSEARQALRTTRRVALPLLEYLDAKRVTRRVDDRRREVVRMAAGLR